MLKESKKNQREKVLAKLKENLTEKEVRQILFIVFLFLLIFMTKKLVMSHLIFYLF